MLTHVNAALPSSMSLLLAPGPAFPQKLTAMHMRRPHLLRKKQVTSTPTSSRKKTTIRMPTMAPVPRPEAPPMASKQQRQGEGRDNQNRQKREKRNLEGIKHSRREWKDRKFERQEIENKEFSHAFDTSLQVSTFKT